jgi:predicted NBD/HSP70 family sugar kinase
MTNSQENLEDGEPSGLPTAANSAVSLRTVDSPSASGPGGFLGLKTSASVDIFTRILTHGPLTRTEITRQTGLSQAAVTKAVAPLVTRGIVTEHTTMVPNGQGRPATPIDVDTSAMLSIGVKVNVGGIFAVVTTMRGKIVHRLDLTIPDTAVETVVDGVVAAVHELLDRTGAASVRVAGVGVTVSGDVDSWHGLVRHSPLLGWRDVALGSLLESRIGLTVFIENDVRALTIAEQWFGIGVGASSFAIVTIGAGIGSGLFLNGRVVEGAFGVAGEIGHLPLADLTVRCTCGRYGCVEAVASSDAIVANIRRSTGLQTLGIKEALALAHSGEVSAVAAFNQAGTAIGMAVASLVNLVGPSAVLVLGEAVLDFDLYESTLRQAFSTHTFGAARECTITSRSHTFDDWARGAAVVVVHKTIRTAL